MAKAPMSASFPSGKLRGRAASLLRRQARVQKTPRKVVRLAKEVKRGRGCRFLTPEPVALPRVDVVLQEHVEPNALRAQVFLCESVQERGLDGYLRPHHLRSTEITALWWRYVGAAKLVELAKAKKAAASQAVSATAALPANDASSEGDDDDPLFG